MGNFRILDNDEFAIANDISIFYKMHYDTDPKSKFYVGITNDIQRRLFDEHEVDKNDGVYFFRKATSHKSAGKIEKELLAKHPKLDGDTGGGDEKTVYVYIYKTTDSTVQRTDENKHFDDAGLLLS